MEIWKSVPGYPGYEASTLGRIRSVDRFLEYEGRWGTTKRLHRGRVLRLKRKPNGCGLTYLTFYADGGFTPQVNRTVCLTFNGEPPSKKHEAAHLDGKTENNRPENLEWKTPIENAADKVRHGTAPIGTKNAMSRLNDEAAADIIDRYASGETSKGLAAEYKVSVSNIRIIARGDSWKHVESTQRDLAKSMCWENMINASRRANFERSVHASR